MLGTFVPEVLDDDSLVSILEGQDFLSVDTRVEMRVGKALVELNLVPKFRRRSVDARLESVQSTGFLIR